MFIHLPEGPTFYFSITSLVEENVLRAMAGPPIISWCCTI